MERHEAWQLYLSTDWKHMREADGLSVSEIARVIGVSRPTYYDLEGRKPTCSESCVRALLAFWGYLDDSLRNERDDHGKI